MTSEQKEILKLFQCEENRLKEEHFACGFTRNDNVRLAFINEGRAFTDGVNITVDPAMDNLFTDDYALRKTSEILGFKQLISGAWTALFLTTRAQEVHECLHIVFTQFPPPAVSDSRSTNRIRMTVLAMIDNIIEDAFIENAGVSEFPDMEIFLRWGRVAHLLAAKPAHGTVEDVFAFAKNAENAKSDDQKALEYILDYNAGILLYPMAEVSQPLAEYEEYIQQTAPLFLEGSLCGIPEDRHFYACKIFDILEPLLPKELPKFIRLKKLLGAHETHSSGNKTFAEYTSSGRKAKITRRLFTGKDGQPIAFDESGVEIEQLIAICDERFREIAERFKTVHTPGFVIVKGSSTGAAAMHRGIQIKEIHPVSDASLAKSYQMIEKHYRRVINNYIRRFGRLIHTENAYTEDKKYFGAGISSKTLTDVKKRYWYQKYYENGTTEIAVMLMIDGSGSMRGPRRNAAVQSAVILHEVLESNHIEHCIVEHRAIYDEPFVEHNVLLDFRHTPEKKYNIMRLSAVEGTREGLSLFWAEKYLSNHAAAENKIIIMISDGLPEHECDDSEYIPPVSVKDTANAAAKIMHRGTKIVAVALGSDCYQLLKEIYPKTIECCDLEKLTGQLLKVISDELNR